jgi:hypothetical protein
MIDDKCQLEHFEHGFAVLLLAAPKDRLDSAAASQPGRRCPGA